MYRNHLPTCAVTSVIIRYRYRVVSACGHYRRVPGVSRRPQPGYGFTAYLGKRYIAALACGAVLGIAYYLAGRERIYRNHLPAGAVTSVLIGYRYRVVSTIGYYCRVTCVSRRPQPRDGISTYLGKRYTVTFARGAVSGIAYYLARRWLVYRHYLPACALASIGIGYRYRVVSTIGYYRRVTGVSRRPHPRDSIPAYFGKRYIASLTRGAVIRIALYLTCRQIVYHYSSVRAALAPIFVGNR